MPNHKKTIKEGTRFGRLVVMYESSIKKNNQYCYHCKCDCGNEVDVRGYSLRHGETKSCGCLSKELASLRNKNKNIHDLTNQRFGLLVVVAPTDERKNGSVVWKCKCDCGNEALVSSKNLVHGDTKSCGCLRSQGEIKIKQLLQEYNIPFQTEYSFPDLVSQKGYPLRFDFYVNNSYLIEFDGEQHFSEKTLFSHDNLRDRQYNDMQKTLYAQNHNIPLIRIPYTKLSTLSINDIIL